jgi:hypothetical protein
VRLADKKIAITASIAVVFDFFIPYFVIVISGCIPIVRMKTSLKFKKWLKIMFVLNY